MRKIVLRPAARAACLLGAAATLALAPFALHAQVSDAVAAQNRALGERLDLRAALHTYAPLEERAPYHGVQVQRDVAYGKGTHQRLDLFVPSPIGASAPRSGALRPVLIFAPPLGDAQAALGAHRRVFDNVALWAARAGLIGVTMRRRDDFLHARSQGPEDFAALIGWLQGHVQAEGGDPQRLIVVGAGVGGTQLLRYLAGHQYWCCRGPGIAAAALLSPPLTLAAPSTVPAAPLLAGSAAAAAADPGSSDLTGLDYIYVPVFLGSAVFESDVARRSVTRLQQELCRRGRCPTVREFLDHNLLSAVLSFDTADQSVSRQLQAWMHNQHLL